MKSLLRFISKNSMPQFFADDQNFDFKEVVGLELHTLSDT